MCGIVGISGIPNSDSNVKKMFSILEHRGPDACGIYSSGDLSIGNTLLRITGNMPQPLVGKGALVLNGEIFNFRDLANDAGLKTDSDTEVLFSLIEAKIKEGKEPVDSVFSVLSRVNGDYALAYACGDELVLARDPVGVKPLFYSLRTEESENGELIRENKELKRGERGEREKEVRKILQKLPQIYFASEKKAFAAFGAELKAEPLSPGTVLGFNTKTGETTEKSIKISLPGLSSQNKRISEEKDAIPRLRKALEKAVELRLTPDAGIAFSGGLDSALLAVLAKKIYPEICLYTVGLPGSHDIVQAEYAAEALGMKTSLFVHFLSPEEIEAAIPHVIYATESTDPMKISIGLPLYIIAKILKENGKKVLLTGQGADELFGGYKRHENLLEKGLDVLDLEIYSDIEKISELNLERDDLVTMANSVELRVPFLDKEVLKTGLAISPELKVLKTAEGYIRKYILRKAAEGLLPPEILRKEKKAMQYGTGVQKVLEKLARNAMFSKKEGKPLEKYLQFVAGKLELNTSTNE